MATGRQFMQRNTCELSPPKSRKNLIINYIPSNFSDHDLATLFSQVGPVANARIIKNKDGSNKGFGFVNFHNHEDAKTAIQRYKQYPVNGKRLRVAFTIPGGPRGNCNIFASRLPIDWTDETLRNIFVRFGNLIECRILYDANGNSRRSAFVRFSNQDSAYKAVEELGAWAPPGDEPIKLRIATKQSEHWKNKQLARGITLKRMPKEEESVLQNLAPQLPVRQAVIKGLQNVLFIYNLPLCFDPMDVSRLCEHFGTLDSVQLQLDNQGQSVGIAIVAFRTRDSALTAERSLKGVMAHRFFKNELATMLL